MQGFFKAAAVGRKRSLWLPLLCLIVCWIGGTRPDGCQARTLEVGPTRDLTGPSQAAKVAHDGDIIVFDPGIYQDCAVWTASGLTLQSRPPPPGMNATVMAKAYITGPSCVGRGLFVFLGSNITVRGLAFQHARAPWHNGAGILMEGANLLVENSEFQDNENGILAGGPPTSVVRISHVLFRRNGSCEGQCAHALYVGQQIALLEVTGCIFLETRSGHSVKSRARATVVRDSRIDDGPDGTSSYLIELPDGGDGQIVNNLLHKGPRSENRETAISVGAEDQRNPTRVLEIRGNRFTSDLPDPVRFVRNNTPAPARLSRNTLIGNVIPLEGPGTVE